MRSCVDLKLKHLPLDMLYSTDSIIALCVGRSVTARLTNSLKPRQQRFVSRLAPFRAPLLGPICYLESVVPGWELHCTGVLI
jgi:hypothetical protein